jgi:hypothetical protein
VRARLVPLATAAVALAAMGGALAVAGGRDADAARVAAARQQAIEDARMPAMRTSFLAATVPDRLEAARRARERAAAARQSAGVQPELQASWRSFGDSVFPGERPDVIFEPMRQPPFGRVRDVAAAPAWQDVRPEPMWQQVLGAGGTAAAQAGASGATADSWPRSGWAPTASTVVGVSSATPTR